YAGAATWKGRGGQVEGGVLLDCKDSGLSSPCADLPVFPIAEDELREEYSAFPQMRQLWAACRLPASQPQSGQIGYVRRVARPSAAPLQPTVSDQGGMELPFVESRSAKPYPG